jgi:hypothetical protein
MRRLFYMGWLATTLFMTIAPDSSAQSPKPAVFDLDKLFTPTTLNDLTPEKLDEMFKKVPAMAKAVVWSKVQPSYQVALLTDRTLKAAKVDLSLQGADPVTGAKFVFADGKFQRLSLRCDAARNDRREGHSRRIHEAVERLAALSIGPRPLPAGVVGSVDYFLDPERKYMLTFSWPFIKGGGLLAQESSITQRDIDSNQPKTEADLFSKSELRDFHECMVLRVIFNPDSFAERPMPPLK